MVRNASTTTDDERELPQILRGADLAAILTPLIDDMVTEATARYEAQGIGRVMAAPLAAVRGLVDQVRRYHALPVLVREPGTLLITTDGREPVSADA
jgi:predicted ATP-grasp superfamily ATP-dependent carboligase